ncbi:major facilitator superfamily domain-containing protein 6-like protein B [Gigantopelta aegis]|uniref:major facilitator superfamily domain-containing protein 6-like protein B n=1 Tax=Gigantopelta aegis TaxID=1735272 RepID=UPI001B88D8A7|nr:major facilitator superfamily domain-containing protein 6-like protein B [Gigantopelta aegis]
METVNISRSILICNVFQFFFASSKACLLPFLTLFFRLMGLNAVETGIIIAAKTLTGFVWAPIWARCAIAYNKRRIVLIFSLMVMAATYFTMTIVYSHVSNNQFSCNKSFHSGDGVLGTTVNKSGGNNSYGTNSVTMSSKIQPTGTFITMPVTNETIYNTAQAVSNISKLSTTSIPTSSLMPTSPFQQSKLKKLFSIVSQLNLSREDKQEILKSFQSYKEGKMSLKDVINMVGRFLPKSRLHTRDISGIWNDLQTGLNEEEEDHLKRSEMNSLQKRFYLGSWSDVKDRVKKLMNGLKEKELELFLIVLLLVVLGEFLSCPVEKVADDAWFDFLDRIDDLEKYGKQRLSGSMAFILIPVIITLVVDYTDCILPYNIHHFLIHIYLFIAFIVVTMIVAIFYPIPSVDKQKYSSKFGQGMRIVCCDCSSVLYVLTLLLLGMVYASFNNFLFWLIQDLGGKEVTMGLCVTIATLAEIPMLLFSGKMIRKLGNAGVISISLVAMALRMLYYSFLWNPWVVIPIELMHAFTHTAMWYAVLSFDDYNVGPAVDRSIRSILSSIYFGIGFSVGSVVSGVVWHIFGSSVLYWSASVLCAVWSFLFFVIQKCLPKKERIRYIRLLPGEDGMDSGGDDEDWLEMALKEQ